MSQLTHDYSFPSVMREKLQAVRWRQAGLSAIRAIAMSCSVLILLMIAAMSLDWIVTLFDARVRIALTGLTLVGSLFVLLRTGVRPVTEAFGWSRAAGKVDERIPQMEERWKTVASFAQSQQQPANTVARAMLQQVTSEAVAMSTLVRPRDVAKSATIRQPLMLLTGASVALVVFLLSNYVQTSILLLRFWSPTANISATQLQSLTGDIIVPRGQSVEIKVGVKGLQPNSATMSISGEQSSLLKEDILLESSVEKPTTLSATVDVDESFRYRVQAGDGRTEWHTVTAIDFPALSEIRMTVTPPKYVDEPVAEKTLIPGRIRAVQGSQLELAMRPEQELKSLTLLLTIPANSVWLAADDSSLNAVNSSESGSATPDTTRDATSPETVKDLEDEQLPQVQKRVILKKGGDGWYHFETQLIDDFALSPILMSPHGLSNENPRTCQIEVIEDKAPTARIIGPESEASAAADESVEIRFEAHDDHGVMSAELVVYDADVKEGEEPRVLAVKQIPLGDQELRKHVMGKTELNLKELNLEEGQNISYAIRVTDNRSLEMEPDAARDQLFAQGEEAGAEKSASDEKTGNVNADASARSDEEDSALAEMDENSGAPSQENSDPLDRDRNGQSSDAPATEDGDGNKLEDSALLADSGTNEPRTNDYEQMLDDAQRKESDEQSEKNGAGSPDDKDLASQNPPGAKSGNNEDSGDAKNDPSTATDAKVAGQESGDEKIGDSESSDAAGNQSATESPVADGEMTPEENSKTADSSSLPLPDSSKAENSQTNGSAADQKTDGKSESESPGDSSEGPGLEREMPQTDTEIARNDETLPAGDSETPGNAEKGSAARTGEAEKNSNIANAVGGGNANNSGDSKNSTKNSPKNQKSPEKQAMVNAEQSAEPAAKVRARGQQSDAGQQQETDRRRLRISDRLDALAKRNEEQIDIANPVREKVVQIDEMLKVVETRLTALYKHEVDENLRGEGFQELDVRLGDIEGFINELNLETQNTAFEFIGLQMVEISTGHVTPARDAVFVAIRRPDSGADAHTEEALHHVVSAREMLQALLKRYDSVRQEQELARKIDEAIKMYTVYVEGTQQLMREAQQNFDPLRLQRSLSVIEVDQAYLDRLAEVTRMRRDMMSELAKILGDDPRLRSRYLDLIRRRRASLRSQLAEITARQDQSLQEVLGWLGVSEAQRDNYWMQISDLRLDVPKDMAKEAQQYADRIEKQLPLVLDGGVGAAKGLIELSKQIALDIRRCDFEVRELRKSGGTVAEGTAMSDAAADVVFRIGELLATLDQLGFDNEGQDGIAEYVQLRQAEYRILADRADSWADTVASIETKRYSGLARQDQHQITLSTELLRIAMFEIEADLAGQFNDEVPMPQEVTNLTQDLLRTMESVTFNQSSATFQFSRDQMEVAAARQENAYKGLEEAGKILDQLRRKTIEAIDKIEEPDPNIADLEDPTLDEFLANLEREPDIESQLGIPNRPRNLRVIQDMLTWSQNGQGLLQASGEAAMARINQQRVDRPEGDSSDQRPREEPPKEERHMTDEEKKQLAEAKDMQQMLKDQMQQTMEQLQQKANDPNTPEAARRQMQEMAQRMSRALEEMKNEQNSAQLWQQIVEADQAKAALEALAKGESLPDDQWNKLMSKLDDGLGQVGGRTPPEDYRRAIEQYQERIRHLTGASSE